MLAAVVFLLGSGLVVAWELFCLSHVLLADRVRFLPRWLWAIACLLLIPLGGILFMTVGSVWHRPALN